MYAIKAEIDGERRYYAGYQAESFAKCGPIWNRTISSKARFIEPTADSAMRQLI